jgi:DNA-binding beta-propeller fold protein YncE
MVNNMEKSLCFLFLVLVCNCCSAFSVDRNFSSCDGKYSVVDAGSGSAFLVSNGSKKLIRLGYSADGGAIDQKHLLLAVYGTPKIIDAQYPQAIVISIFRNLNDPRRVSRMIVGGGVYDIAFSLDGKFLVVDHKFGTLIIDIRKNKSYLADSKSLKVIKCG